MHELETLPIFHCCRIWRRYLEGTAFIMETGHPPLKFFNSQMSMPRRMTRWMECLGQFNYEIFKCVKGGTNAGANALSRCPHIIILESTALDQEGKYLLGRFPDTFRVICDKLYKIVDGELLPYVPFRERAQVLYSYHNDLGHWGADNLHHTLRTRLYWPNTKPDIVAAVARCPNCQKVTHGKWKIEPLNPLPPVPIFNDWASTSSVDCPSPKARTNMFYWLSNMPLDERLPEQ